jgi:hypothetical protein
MLRPYLSATSETYIPAISMTNTAIYSRSVQQIAIIYSVEHHMKQAGLRFVAM